MPCSICANEVYALGFCFSHYKRNRLYGDPNHVRVYTKKPLEERFWAKVTKGDGCWEWSGAKTSKGYGTIQKGGKGSPHLLAHRVSYEINCGPVPHGMNVLHSCDNRGCVNPAHLRSGTQSENIQEAYSKKRMKGNTRLTEADIIAIRASTEKPGVLAVKYGIIPHYITAIRKRKAWKHIA